MTVLSWIVLSGESGLLLLLAGLAAAWAEKHWARATCEEQCRQ